ALTTVLAVAATPQLGAWLALFRFEPGVHDDMTGYLEWRLWSVGPYIAVEALGNWFAGLGNTRVHMRASVIGAALASGLATCAGLAWIGAAFARRARESAGPGSLALKPGEFVRMLRF